MSKLTTVDYNLVVSIGMKLTIDEKIIDPSDRSEPLNYLHGHNNIIPGLERALLGMTLGDTKHVVVTPQGAYGEIDSEAFSEVPLYEFEDGNNIIIGSNIEMVDEDGIVMIGVVTAIEDSMVKLDFNHPLAGKELHFDVKILALRPATEEELEQGYVQNI
ncbi:MAG: peptidylprolyl isomerase [Chloroflexi bacterium]|nr:peptidylprolyl isomerase [Chloroflexota bacterium]